MQSEQQLEASEPFLAEKTKESFLTEKGKSTAWLIRCSNEQKEFFQKVSSESGKNVADFISGALETYKIKSNIGENARAYKEITEAEHLIERLTSLIRSKILILSEQEIQMQEELTLTKQQRAELQLDFDTQAEELKKEFSEKQAQQEALFLEKTLEIENKREEDAKVFEEEKFMAHKKIEHLQDSLFKKTQEIQIHQKQVNDSMRLFESIEQRNTELKKSLDKLESENAELKKDHEKFADQARSIDALNHKIEILKITYEQEMKRLHSEHELKIKIKEQEVENKYRTS